MRGTTCFSVCSLVFVLLIQVAFVIFYANYLYFINPDPEEGYKHSYGNSEICEVKNSSDKGCGTCYVVETEECCNTCNQLIAMYDQHQKSFATSGVTEVNCNSHINAMDVIEFSDTGKKEVCRTSVRLIWHPYGATFLLIDSVIVLSAWIIFWISGKPAWMCCGNVKHELPEHCLKPLMNSLIILITADALCTVLLDFGLLWTYFDYGLPIRDMTILVTTQVMVGCKLIYCLYSWIARCKYLQQCCFEDKSEIKPPNETFNYPPSPKQHKSKKSKKYNLKL